MPHGDNGEHWPLAQVGALRGEGEGRDQGPNPKKLTRGLEPRTC